MKALSAQARGQAMREAWRLQVARDPELSAAGKAVAVEIEKHVNNETLEAFPSQERMAHDSGRSLRSVEQGVRALRLRGHVTIRKEGFGRNKKAFYRLVLRSDLEPIEDATSIPARPIPARPIPARSEPIPARPYPQTSFGCIPVNVVRANLPEITLEAEKKEIPSEVERSARESEPADHQQAKPQTAPAPDLRRLSLHDLPADFYARRDGETDDDAKLRRYRELDRLCDPNGWRRG